MIFEEHVVTQEKWHRSYSLQMTLRLGLSEPHCEDNYTTVGNLYIGVQRKSISKNVLNLFHKNA